MGWCHTLIGDESRNSLLAGVNALADAVKVTLGPYGRYVAMHQKANVRGSEYSDRARPDAPVLVTNDGVTVARSIVLRDPVQETGARLVREAAIKANDVAGDGTTTAIVIAQALLAGALRCVAAGADPIELRRGVDKAGAWVQDSLRADATPVTDASDLARVATVSCRDEKIGAMVGDAFEKVGREGVVAVDDWQRADTALEVAEGIVIDRGLLSPHLATDSSGMKAELSDPYILLTDKKLENPQEIIPALICAAEDGRDMLVVCDGVGDEVLGLLVENKRQGDMNVACVLAPGYGEGRRWRMQDIAVQTGATYMTEEQGVALRDVTREELGAAERVRVQGKRTTIFGGKGDPAAIAERVKELRYLANNTDYEFNRKRHAERLARFVSGIATIKVGGTTEAEQRQRQMLVEDATNAARSALDGGILPGGGAALVHAVASVEHGVGELVGDERTGARIALDACLEPQRQIVRNAGRIAGVVEHRVRELGPRYGYDASTASYVDMIQRGIIDPLKVTLAAQGSAFSVASTVLGVEAGVVSGDQVDASIKQLIERRVHCS
ncbi:MAG: Hsp60 family chaperonin [Tractidigestivibacter sp.]|uniref:Hsp60 family chaperonin n=1 Tax=Tractidigestivibacter sp. TaxID=2847320 RepID=UPI003D92ADD8